MSNIDSIPKRSHRFKDETGARFGSLTVVKEVSPSRLGGSTRWACICDCGASTDVDGSTLRKGDVKSCGCAKSATCAALATTHGMTHSPEYRAWVAMWARCTNTNHKNFLRYEARRPPEAWKSFEEFFSEVGLRPTAAHSLDRIENEKPYGPGNCRWAVPEVQQGNKGVTIRVNLNGQEMSLKRACRECNLGYTTVYQRLRRGGFDMPRASEGMFDLAT